MVKNAKVRNLNRFAKLAKLGEVVFHTDDLANLWLITNKNTLYAVIFERTGKKTRQFFLDIIAFIERHITDEIINQELNTLLSYEKFSRIRKVLKQETLIFLRDELKRIE